MSNVAIIGAGISGLSAATELKRKSIPFTIYEADNRIGGRMKTDEIDGFQLDHGFQVLLTAYPMAREILDYDDLELAHFFPGAKIYLNDRWKLIGDPLRNPEALIPTLSSGLSSFSDNFKILKLKRELKSVNVNDIFSSDEYSTLEYLKNYGFSDKMIQSFFKPFFSGIFLESNLSTSSRMFAFVFKMFSEGYAALPKKGIQAIPNQLAEKIGFENIKLEHKLSDIKDSKLIFENGDDHKHDIIINAVNWSNLDSMNHVDQSAHQVYNLYFSAEEAIDKKGILYLNGKSTSLINNIAFPDAIQNSYAPENKHLISASVLSKGELTDAELLTNVKSELKTLFGNVANEWTFLKQYNIPNALPQKPSIDLPVGLKYEHKGVEIIRAGDISYYGSLNAALLSGKRAAKAIFT